MCVCVRACVHVCGCTQNKSDPINLLKVYP